MTPSAAIVIGAVFAVAATIVLCIMVVPEKKKSTLKNGFLIFLHDLFNFKTLFIEKILKLFYILSTTMCIFVGFFMLFAQNRYFYGYGYGYAGGRSYFLPGLMLLVLGPILIRIVYESIMLTIILVKNTIDINKKLGAPAAKADDAPAAATSFASTDSFSFKAPEANSSSMENK